MATLILKAVRFQLRGRSDVTEQVMAAEGGRTDPGRSELTICDSPSTSSLDQCIGWLWVQANQITCCHDQHVGQSIDAQDKSHTWLEMKAAVTPAV